MNLLPIIDKNKLILNGSFVKAPEYCQKNCTKGKCREYYKELEERGMPGFFSCPKGFSSYVAIDDDGCTIYTSFKEKNSYSRKMSNKEVNTKSFSPIMDESQIITLVSASQTVNKYESEIIQKSLAITSISHEVKKLNGRIKEHCENIFATYQLDYDLELSLSDLQKLREEIRTIFICSSMIDSRYLMYEYELKGDQSLLGKKVPCGIYAKFDKIRRIFKNYQYKNITIELEGNSYEQIQAYFSFQMIPLLLIDNAIKYSLPNNEVKIIFARKENILNVQVQSFSPYCSKSECLHIFEKEFRGENAKKTSDGSGLGLYFVKRLCDLHNITISAISSDKITIVNNIPYSMFTINLDINLK